MGFYGRLEPVLFYAGNFYDFFKHKFNGSSIVMILLPLLNRKLNKKNQQEITWLNFYLKAFELFCYYKFDVICFKWDLRMKSNNEKINSILKEKFFLPENCENYLFCLVFLFFFQGWLESPKRFASNFYENPKEKLHWLRLLKTKLR